MAEGEARLPELNPVAATRFTTLPIIHHHEVNGLDKGARELGGSKLEHDEVPNPGDWLFHCHKPMHMEGGMILVAHIE